MRLLFRDSVAEIPFLERLKARHGAAKTPEGVAFGPEFARAFLLETKGLAATPCK